MSRKRNIQLIFWVSEKERELIAQKMEQVGTENLSAYLRKIAIDGFIIKLDLPELRHLCLDLVTFLRRHIEHQWNGAAALFHRASRSLFEDIDRSAARAGVPCSFSRTETFCWLRCCSAAKSLRT